MFNIALFGAGRIGKIHAQNIHLNPETVLYSVSDVYQDAATALANQYNTKVLSIEEALNDKKIDAVFIATSTDTHADLITKSALAGKAIFCEKPIHLDLKQVHECLETVNRVNVPLFIGFNRRFDPQFSTIKAQFNKGVIGRAESLMIISRDPSPPPISYIEVSGGMFKDMTIHDLDMARFILGEEPISIYAKGSNLVDPLIGERQDIDTAMVVMKFKSGAIATISNSRRSGYGYDQRLELHGEKGLLKADNILINQVSVWNDSGIVATNPEPFFLERYKEAYRIELEKFVDVLLKKSSPASSGYDGERALFLAEKALESLLTQQEIKLL